MKLFNRITFLGFALFMVHSAQAQNASDYFPAITGSRWYYNYVTLDSLQQPIENTRTTIVESLATTFDVAGLSAYVAVSSQFAAESSFVHLDGPIVRQYLRGVPGAGRVSLLDSVGLSSVSNMRNWYPTMNLGSPPAVGVPDTILRIETFLTYDQSVYPVSITSRTTRRSPKSVTVPAGTFSAVPFELNVIADAPLGGLTGTIHLANVTDTIFLVSGKWIVKEVRRSAPLPLEDLSGVGVEKTYHRGFVKELEQVVILDVGPSNAIPRDFILDQNYPNPFNPMTAISFQVSGVSHVRLTVYDVLGRIVSTLADGEYLPGNHTIQWNAAGVPSGVYWYRLETGDGNQTRRMVLVR